MSTIHPSASIPTVLPHSDFGLAQDPQSSAPIAGVSADWRKLIAQAEIAAPHLQVAAIEGEQGAGKFTLARYLHDHSPLAGAKFQRRDAREWLATDGDAGLLEGYLYLDRVDLLASPGQGLLLAVIKALQDRIQDRIQDRLQDRLQDRPMGRAVLLASSQVSLRQMAGQGTFLPDLAFRLTAIRFAVPPLRQRREDISPLAQALLSRLCSRYQQRPVVLGPGTLARLLQHNWPGNVRELASVLEAALFETENGVIQINDLALPAEPDTQTPQHVSSQPEDLSLDRMIREHIQYVLELNRGNKLRAARQLAISRSTLYRILGNESEVAR